METFTLRDLVAALDTGVINQRQFEVKLCNYLHSIYSEIYKRGAASSRFTTPFSRVSISSIVERICIAVFEDPDGFYKATSQLNEFNEIDKILENSYEIFHCEETKVNLGSLPKKQNKRIDISIGLETGTVFVNIVGKKKDRMYNDEPIVATYALADCSLLVQKEKRGNRYLEYDLNRNSIYNSVLCSRFDPSHMQAQNSSGYKNAHKDSHTNQYDMVGVAPQEKLDLYREYFKDKAPCPHFHYFQKDICHALGSNSSSFAINMDDLNRYIKDLETACKANKPNDPILKYNLGMPYLDIMQGKIVCDTSDFINKAKDILKKYSGKDKYDGMILLSAMTDRTKRHDYAGALSAASDIMCFISSTAFNQTGSQDKALSMICAISNAFSNGIGDTVSVKDLRINRERNQENDDYGWEQ